VNNFIIFKHEFWHTLLKHVKFAFELHLPLCCVDVIITSSKMPFYCIRGEKKLTKVRMITSTNSNTRL